MANIVVLIKTHVWSPHIEKFASKILEETTASGTDFFILMHTETGELVNKIKNDQIKKCVLKFTEKEIRALYKIGFYSMWLSNHWILMWFYKKFGSKYKYFWSLEYDVRITGPSSHIWKHQSPHDFLYTLGNYRNMRHQYNSYYVGNKLGPYQKYFGYLQLARYSDKVLAYLNKCFEEGENGQDELITFSLINRGGFTGSKEFLHGLKKGVWTWQSRYSDYNKKLYDRIEKIPSKQVCIFHPVK